MPEDPPPLLPAEAPPIAPLDTESAAETAACPNCGVGGVGAYCAACGQKNAPLRQPVHVFLQDAATEYFGLDGRLWRSLGLLLLHPGRLTNAYLQGQRARYLRPLRLYLTATLLFFFLLSVLDPVEKLEQAVSRDDTEEDTTVAVRDRLAALDAMLVAQRAEEEEQAQLADSLRGALADLQTDSLGVATLAGVGEGIEALEEALAESEEELEDLRDASAQRHRRRIEWQRDLLATWPPDSLVQVGTLDEAAERLFPDSSPSVEVNLPAWMPTGSSVERFREARTDEEATAAIADFTRNAFSRLPTVMFLLLPVFALLLKLIYLRRDWYYSEHLVFALHTHAFAFLVFAAVTLLVGFTGGAAWAGMVATVLMVLLPVYFYVAQKRVYGQGWIKTAFKALLLGWLYGFALSALGLTLAIMLAAAFG